MDQYYLLQFSTVTVVLYRVKGLTKVKVKKKSSDKISPAIQPL